MEGRIIKFLAYEGRALVKCIDSTNIVEEARKIHDLSPTVTAALGRLLTMTSMMGADLKEIEDSKIENIGKNYVVGGSSNSTNKR